MKLTPLPVTRDGMNELKFKWCVARKCEVVPPLVKEILEREPWLLYVFSCPGILPGE